MTVTESITRSMGGLNEIKTAKNGSVWLFFNKGALRLTHEHVRLYILPSFAREDYTDGEHGPRLKAVDIRRLRGVAANQKDYNIGMAF